MNSQSMLNILSLSSLHRRVLAVIFVSMFFIGNFTTAHAQAASVTARLADTLGWGVDISDPANHVALSGFINDVVCVEAQGFSRIIQVGRYGGRSWVDAFNNGNLRFTSPAMPHGLPGWTIFGVAPGDDGIPFDQIMMAFSSNPAEDAFLEYQLGGYFTFEIMESGEPAVIATINIPFRPVASTIGTIFMDSIFCEGSTVRAWVFRRPPGGFNSAISEFYDNMIFRWTVLDEYGLAISNNFGNTYPSTNHFLGDTAFLIRNFDPNRHKSITVQRVFCRSGVETDFIVPYGRLSGVPYQTRNFADDPDIIVISNPPLDTSADNRQDILMRLAWIGDHWMEIPVDAPVCVNYVEMGRAANQMPVGFLSGNPLDDPTLSGGFLFFQVGTVPDTMVNYVWGYDPERLERVFVGQTLESGQAWSSFTGVGDRWVNPTDYAWVANNWGGGGFGQRRTAANPYSEYSFRAAFRVRSLDYDDPRRLEPVRIGVRPICSFCETTDGIPFRNDSLVANLGRAWDTIRPMNMFDVQTVLSGTTDNVRDTVCQGATLNFFASPHSSVNVGGFNWWNRDSLAAVFNISRFDAHVQNLHIEGRPYIHFLPGGAGPAVLTGYTRFIGTRQDLDRPVTPSWQTFTPANNCFVRGRPVVANIGIGTDILGRDSFYFSAQDERWHYVKTFFVQQRAERPLVVDAFSGLALRPIDTIFICRSDIMLPTGEDIDLTQIDGREFILGMGTRLPNGMPVWEELPSLMKNSSATPNIDDRRWFHGFFETRGHETNPNDIDRVFEDYETDDIYRRTRMRLQPSEFFTGDGGEFMFAAQDACGRGDSIAIPFVIIDTVSLHLPIYVAEALMGPNIGQWSEDGLGAGVYPCEDGRLLHRVLNLETYQELRGTRIHWGGPDTWDGGDWYGSSATVGGTDWNQLSVRFSKEPGQIWVHARNQCGGSRRVFSPIIEPIPHFRTEADWIDFDICQGEILRFEFDEVEENEMDTLFIVFPGVPNTYWSVVGNSAFGSNAWAPLGKGNRDTLTNANLFPPVRDSFNIFVEVLGGGTVNGSTTNFVIRVRQGDHFQFTFAPNAGNIVTGVVVDGENLADAEYLTGVNIYDVQENRTVSIAFLPGTEPNLGDLIFPDVLPANPRDVTGVYFDVWVNDSFGGHQEILVSWEFAVCAGRRDRYWDTIQIFTNTLPSMPLKAESWDKHDYNGYFTFCLRDTVWLSVNPALKDTIQYNYYNWTFPPGWGDPVEWGSRGVNSDSVRIVVGILGVDDWGNRLDVDTIRVEAISAICGDGAVEAARREFSTLVVPVRVMDTVVFEMDSLLDAAREYYQFVSDICRDERLRLFVRLPYWATYHSVDSIGWRWGSTEDIDANVPVYTDEGAWGDWRFTNRNDTLAIDLDIGGTGTDPASLYIQMIMQNRCGISIFQPIALTVAYDNLHDSQVYFEYPWDGGTAQFCEGDVVRLSVVPIGNADYIWDFPWYPYTRTTQVAYIYLDIPEVISSIDSVITVRAFNTCDTTALAYAAQLEVTEILLAPGVPRIYNTTFGRGVHTAGGYDWISDTVCLRQQLDAWQIAIHEDDGIYGGDWAPFQWRILGAGGVGASNDINVIFDFTSSTDSSTFDVRAQDAGVDAGIYNTWITVAAVRERCPAASGELLRIKLTSVDTIPIADIEGWHGIAMNGSSYPTWPEPCSEDIITLSVENDLAVGYRWILPADDDTWAFADNDTTRGSVQIIVGNYPARIGVITTTNRGDGLYFCGEDFVNQDTLWSHVITPFSGPILVDFLGFSANECAEAGDITIEVQLDPNNNLADQFRFTIGRHRALYTDSTEWQPPFYETSPTFVIPELGDWRYDSITVMVHAINNSRCPGLPAKVSDSIVRTFRVFNSARIIVDGVLGPCRNVTQTYTIEVSDPSVTFVFDYRLFAATPADYSTLERFPAMGRPETIVLHTNMGDSVQLIFTHVSTGQCTFPDSDDTVTIVMNTAILGGFDFQVLYHEAICRNINQLTLEIINVGLSPTGFEQEWFRFELDTTFVTIGDQTFAGQVDTTSMQSLGTAKVINLPQSQFASADVHRMNFMVATRYEVCLDGVIEYTLERIFFTVTVLDPVVARIDANVVRIVGNTVEVVRPFFSDIDSVALGENLRFIGRAEGREPYYPHLVLQWWGDFESYIRTGDTIVRFAPMPANSDTIFTGSIFFDEQSFFFAVYDTSAFGCFSMDAVHVSTGELTGSSIDSDVFGDVPNAFTPHNQDGVNDIFMAGVDRLTILNRWGVVIFHAEGAAARNGWDGRDSRTNRMVDRGDYFFIIEIHRPNVTNSNQPPYTHSKTGVVTVL